MYAPLASFLVPADSARAIGDVYSISLVATLPIVASLVAYLFLRQASAGTRAIVWRCTLVGLLAIYAGRFVPWQWMAWVLPEPLARPLVTLGTVHLDVPPGVTRGTEPSSLPLAVRGLLALYWSGVIVVLLRTLVARVRLSVVRQQAMALTGPRWRARLHVAGKSTGVATESVQLLTSTHVRVPVTWGLLRPVILLPHAALRWPADQLQAVLRHELAHVGARDATMRLAARFAGALFWFHPGVWWLVRRFEADAEQASDDRVLASGIRASDYAEWLAASAPGADRRLNVAMALARPGNLRARLAAVTNTQRRIAIPGRGAVIAATALSIAAVAPLATARLAPTHGVLTSMMQDSRWESRAWAVVRLARRADSVDVARSAANHDPEPAVRAWARYALGLVPTGKSGSDTDSPGS